MLSPIRSILLRLAGGAPPRPIQGVIALALMGVLGTAWGATLVHRALTDAEFPAYLDRATVEAVFAAQTWIMLPGSAGLLAAALLSRKRWPDSRLLAHCALQFYAVLFALSSYAIGHYTDPFGAFGLFLLVALGGLFFEASIVRAGLFSFVGILLATTVAEQMGIIPYAPLFTRPRFEGGHLHSRWLLFGASVYFITTIVAFFVLAVMQLGRDREKKLQRATALIRRYVPEQLAAKILAGEHTATVQPERRKVTLFFSDVVGFTPAADQMEPEDLSALLNEYLSEMAHIAQAHGATINQFVGDGIMIFFGAPEATSDRDHALRAVKMALAMQRRMVELREKWFGEGIQTPFHVRIGINTGVASVGDFGSEGRTTYSAIGNQTNLTARIQDQCEPGKVLLSHTTWAFVRDEIPCKERGEIEAKGLHYPVRVYEVVGEASHRGDS